MHFQSILRLWNKHYKKKNKSVLNTILFYDNHKEVKFDGEVLISTLQLIKIWTKEMSFQKFKSYGICFGQEHYSGTKNIVGEIKFNKKKLVERLSY